MKRLIATFLALVVLGAGGYLAYRVGLLPGMAGPPATGEHPTAAATTSSLSPAEGGAAGSVSVTQSGAPAATADATGAAAQATAETPAPTTDVTSSGGAAPTPIPAGLVAVAKEGEPVSNKAIEVRVTNLRTAATIGNRPASDGREYVIVDSDWKSLVPPQKVNRKKAQDRTAGMGSLGFGGGATAKDQANDETNTTLEDVPFDIGPLTEKVRLVVNGGNAETIDVAATNATDAHLPTGTLRIPAQNVVKSGPLVFQAPAGAPSLSLLVLDAVNGHLLVPIRGAAPLLASSLGGPSRSNDLVDLAVTGASWADAPSPVPGTKRLVVSLKGISRQNAIAEIPFGDFSFLQTDAGCVAQPERADKIVTRPFAPKGSFIPFVPTEGQLAFTVPADTQSATLLLRLRQGGSLDLPALGDRAARKPPFVVTHDDGKVLRLSVVGAGAPPDGLPQPRAGSEYLVVDYVVENLTAQTGVELQLAQQFTIADEGGVKYQPDRVSQQLPCRLTGRNVVPAGGWRRFSLAYTVPPGQPLTLHYRGFESEGSLKVR